MVPIQRDSEYQGMQSEKGQNIRTDEKATDVPMQRDSEYTTMMAMMTGQDRKGNPWHVKRKKQNEHFGRGDLRPILKFVILYETCDHPK